MSESLKRGLRAADNANRGEVPRAARKRHAGRRFPTPDLKGYALETLANTCSSHVIDFKFNACVITFESPCIG